ncbi:hypothetical protein VTK73DRAFT_8277 [Phialemonium thermophilum]|uniref:Uncharacterized protein n=1 Tax=Phialemonium thermophilum TaxID=223376 RepID=A0ABR3W9Z4_9PEZI
MSACLDRACFSVLFLSLSVRIERHVPLEVSCRISFQSALFRLPSLDRGEYFHGARNLFCLVVSFLPFLSFFPPLSGTSSISLLFFDRLSRTYCLSAPHTSQVLRTQPFDHCSLSQPGGRDNLPDCCFAPGTTPLFQHSPFELSELGSGFYISPIFLGLSPAPWAALSLFSARHNEWTLVSSDTTCQTDDTQSCNRTASTVPDNNPLPPS